MTNGLKTELPISCSDWPATNNFSCTESTGRSDIMSMIHIKEKFHQLCHNLIHEVKGGTQIQALLLKFLGE